MTKGDKKFIRQQWLGNIPILKEYSPTNLMCLSDVGMFGINIANDRWGGNTYKVIFQILALWKIKPNLDIDYLPVNYNQIFQDYNKDSFDKAYETVNHKFGLFFQKEVSVKQIFCYLNEYIATCFNNCHKEVGAYELKLALAVYFNHTELKKLVMRSINVACEYWDDKQFEFLFHCSIAEWKKYIFDMFSDRDKFIQEINKKQSTKKVQKLNKVKLIMDINSDDLELLNPTPINYASKIEKLKRFFRRIWRKE